MVEKGMMSEAEALARKHPIAAFTLDALTAGAAKLRPDRAALAEAGPGLPTQALKYGGFDRQVRALAQHFTDLGLASGERVLIVTGARTACVVATIAALAAGLEPLLVPVGLEAAELAAVAASSGCVAIAGPTSYAALNLEETLFDAAARSETIRVVATLGPAEADGAIDLAPER
jgi:non-ribosomal peptide synthetase component E (peptide arylation enzyme)